MKKKIFFKLELEQLLDEIWMQVKSSDVVIIMQVQDKLEIINLIEQLPPVLIC